MFLVDAVGGCRAHVCTPWAVHFSTTRYIHAYMHSFQGYMQARGLYLTSMNLVNIEAT